MNQTALVFACATVAGTLGLKRFPFPDSNTILQLVLFHKPWIFHALRWGWFTMLFTTPGLLFSGLFSLVFIFTSNKHRAVKGELPPFPQTGPAAPLRIVIGELHNPREPIPSEHPSWLSVPDRGLFTGMAIFGAIGSGKTTCCMRPFAKQVLEYRANDPHRRIGGLVMEVKGDFCYQVQKLLRTARRAEDYVEISLTGPYRYNPLHNDLDAFTLAYSIASLLNNLYGKGKEPFWQQAYTNLVKFIILLYKVTDGYVTLFQVYEAAISKTKLTEKIAASEELFAALKLQTIAAKFVVIDTAVYDRSDDLSKWNWSGWKAVLRTEHSEELETTLKEAELPYITVEEPAELDPVALAYRLSQFEAVKRWHTEDWLRLQDKLRSSVVEGIAVFLSMFDDNPDLKRVFCPPKETYDPVANQDGRYGLPLPAFSSLIETGKLVALNFPVSANPGIARAMGVFMKQDFQRAMLNRIPLMERNPRQYFREALFLCDEYQAFATVGESDPTGDEKFFALSRQAKGIAIVATQSISSLKTSLGGNDTYKTLLQTFRTKIFLSLSDPFSADQASDLCGRENQMSPSYSIAESGQDVRVSTLTGRALAHKAGMSVNKSFAMAWRPVFEPKIFMELKNAQSIVLAYDGLNPLPAQLCYLKPYYLDPNVFLLRTTCQGTNMNALEMILPYLRPIEYLIGDEEVSEIMVNADGRVFAEKNGLIKMAPDVLLTERFRQAAVRNIARLLADDISEERPLLDSRLPDGSRVAAVFGPTSIGGTILAIRKFRSKFYTADEMVRIGSLSVPHLEKLRQAVEAATPFSSAAEREPVRQHC